MATTQTKIDSDLEADASESDSEGQSPSYQHGIGVQPTTYETKAHDREKVAFVKIPASMGETFTSGPQRGAKIIAKLLTKAEVLIDKVEQFAWGVTDGVIYAFRSETPSRKLVSQGDAENCANGVGPLPEPLQTTYNSLEDNLPDSLTIRIGTLPMELFGPEPAVGTRLVMKEQNQKPASRQAVSGADAEALFENFAGEPLLYHVLYRHSSNLPDEYEYQVTVRIFVFNPKYKISTQSEYAKSLQYDRKCDPAESFADLGVSSSLAVIDDGYLPDSLDETEVVPARGSGLPHFSTGQSLINGTKQFTQMQRGHYGASDVLEDQCAYTSLLAREIDLEHYVGLTTTDRPIDPWEKAPQATGLDIDEVGTDPQELLPDEITITVDAAVEETEFDQELTTANDGTEEHKKAIKHVAIGFKTDGYDAVIIDQDTESRPDLWVRRDDGEIFAVEVEYRTRSKAGSFYTNLIRQAVWGYKTITVMVPQTDDEGRTESLDTLGKWALNSVAIPMKNREPTKTQLHNCSGDIVVDGKTLLLPDGVSEARWWLTCEPAYLLIHDGQVLARGDPTEPFEAFEFNVPRYYNNGDHYVVENKHGKTVQKCEQESDIENTTLRPCHRPVDLSYIQFVEALYCYDPESRELVQQDMTADWDFEQASMRNEKSHQRAFETFLVEHEDDDPILERECRPYVSEWIDQLSTHGHPGPNIYGEYRSNYYSRKRISTDRGMEQSYPGVSFRYPRGLVSPDLPGLNSKPVFPDDWNVAAEDVLREPLIHELDDRSEVDNVAGAEAEDEERSS